MMIEKRSGSKRKTSYLIVLTAVVLAVICGLTLPGCTEKTDYYNEGTKLLDNGEYENAVATFSKCIEDGSRLPEAYRQMGIADLYNGDIPEAIAAFERSLNNMDETDIAFEKDVMYYLASARQRHGDRDKAIEVYTQILNYGYDATAYYLRGKLYLSQGQDDLAKQDFDHATDSNSDYNIFIGVYQAYTDQQKNADGAMYLEEALQLATKQEDAYYERGLVNYYLRDYDTAKEELVKALKVDETSEEVLLLGQVYLAQNDVANARALYQDHIDDKDNAGIAYNGMAMCDIAKQDYDSALDNIEKGLECDNESANQSLLFNEIVVYEYKADWTTAKTKVTAYMTIYPNDEAGIREGAFLETR